MSIESLVTCRKWGKIRWAKLLQFSQILRVLAIYESFHMNT